MHFYLIKAPLNPSNLVIVRDSVSRHLDASKQAINSAWCIFCLHGANSNSANLQAFSMLKKCYHIVMTLTYITILSEVRRGFLIATASAGIPFHWA